MIITSTDIKKVIQKAFLKKYGFAPDTKFMYISIDEDKIQKIWCKLYGNIKININNHQYIYTWEALDEIENIEEVK